MREIFSNRPPYGSSSATQLRDVPLDPVQLAARLAPLGDVAVMRCGPWVYVAAGAIASSDAWVPSADPTVDDGWGHVPRWIGVLPYDAARRQERARWTRATDCRPAAHHRDPAWRRYGAMFAIERERGRVFLVGDEASCRRDLRRAATTDAPRGATWRAQLRPPSPSAQRAHEDRVHEALRLIAAGDLYQINLAYRLVLDTHGSWLEALARLWHAAPSAHAFAASFGDTTVLSTSPERFLWADRNGYVRTSPIKGTRPRGLDAPGDERQRDALATDPKEHAELTMVIDHERNDFGRLARPGSVRLVAPPRIETHRTLHHRLADVVAVLRPDVTWPQLLAATFPGGSVTGAPKVRAMEVIAQLEADRRGLYTGAVGAVGRNGSLRLAVAIRTLTLQDNIGHYHTGGGIVDGSVAARELEETTWKAAQLTALLGDGLDCS